MKNYTNNYVDMVAKLGDPNEAPGGNLFLRKGLSLIPNSLNQLNVLDIGSNTGFSTITIAEHLKKSKVIGIDVIDTMTEVATTNSTSTPYADRISFNTGDAQSMPYKNETFDLVVSSGSLAFIEDPIKAMEESFRILKSDGFLLAIEYFYKEKPSTALLDKVKCHLGVDVSKFTFDYWLDSFISAGFEFEGIEQNQPAVFSPKIRRNQQTSIIKKLGEEEARKMLEIDLDFIDNNKYLTIGIFLLRKPGVIKVFGQYSPVRN